MNADNPHTRHELSIDTICNFLKENITIRAYAGDVVIYQKFINSDPNRIGLIHSRAGEVFWTGEYSIGGALVTLMSPTLETCCLAVISAYLEYKLNSQINGEFDRAMEHFKEELTDEELSSGVSPPYFTAKKFNGSETIWAIFEPGRVDPVGVYETEDEADLICQKMNMQEGRK
jgi:hypothetical protein